MTGAVKVFRQPWGSSWDPDSGPLRLMVDYSAPMPLWGRSWRALNLEPELLQRLVCWQEDFDKNFHYETGWRNDQVKDRWAHEAGLLDQELRSALPDMEIETNLWPLESGHQQR